MNNHNSTILDIIKSHQSLSDPINQYQIADEFILRRGQKITGRRVRLIIEELIEDGQPIISTPHGKGGYCWGNKEMEITECVNRLRKKAAKIFIRARRIKRNYLIEKAKRKNMTQLNIFA